MLQKRLPQSNAAVSLPTNCCQKIVLHMIGIGLCYLTRLISFVITSNNSDYVVINNCSIHFVALALPLLKLKSLESLV